MVDALVVKEMSFHALKFNNTEPEVYMVRQVKKPAYINEETTKILTKNIHNGINNCYQQNKGVECYNTKYHARMKST